MLVESLTNKLAVRGGAAGIVKCAGTSGKRQIVDVLTLAFATDPMARWAYPNSQQYLEYFPNFIRLFGGRAFETETAYYVNGFAAAALWLAPGFGPDEAALVALVENTVSKNVRDDLFAVFERMSEFHPAEPHWYLPLIGVDPAQQNRGYGAMLMQHALAACDREGLPAYLESSNPRNVTLYLRHGFELVGTIQAGSSPAMFAMRRAARKRLAVD
ncbi:MAG TPA: GNAT family N-acetyltransferase [Pyrinomonadaceae bacterium]|jgi:GNAT superfamily N-acetyltransferase